MDGETGRHPPGSAPDGWRYQGQIARDAHPGWRAVPILLGAEAGSLVLWELAGFGIQSGLSVLRVWPTLGFGSLALLPLCTILIARWLGLIGRRPRVVGALVALTLVGPMLLAVYLLEQQHIPYSFIAYGLAVLIVMPAAAAAAAGLVAGLRRRFGDGYQLLVIGAVLGFLIPAVVMRELAIGTLADNLELRGIGIVSIVGAVIFCVSMTPGYVVGSILGGRLPEPTGSATARSGPAR